jgi:hypothetical protein
MPKPLTHLFSDCLASPALGTKNAFYPSGRNERWTMPYLRLYSREIPIEQKRTIAHKLIDITSRTLLPFPHQRNRITVQFVAPNQSEEKCRSEQGFAGESGLVIEVVAHDLTEPTKQAFTAEAGTMLAAILPLEPRSKIIRLLGIKPAQRRRISFKFEELHPAISDPLIADAEQRAA